MAKHHVAERVLHGGHAISLADIEGRFFRSLDNFLSEYVFLANQTVCYCNADRNPVVVFTQRGERREVSESALLRILEMRRAHGPPDGFAMKGLEALQRAVDQALERKRRLGQYAVFRKNGRVVFDGPDAPEEQQNPKLNNELTQETPP